MPNWHKKTLFEDVRLSNGKKQHSAANEVSNGNAYRRFKAIMICTATVQESTGYRTWTLASGTFSPPRLSVCV